MALIRGLLVSAVTGTLLGLSGAGAPSATGGEPWLELPQAGTLQTGTHQTGTHQTGTHLAMDGALVVQDRPGSVQQLVLHIPSGGSRINYGSIHTKVNTESADVVMKSSSGPEGFALNLDLAGAGGFPMLPGRNSVELEYQDQFGRAKYANFILDFADAAHPGGRGFDLIPTAKAPERRAGRLFAVVIGISHYAKHDAGHDGRISDLLYADRDAKSMLEFLQSPAGGGVASEDALLLVNEQATTQNIRHALFTFLTRAQEQDTVVVYIAGHGAPDPHDPRNLYLLTADTDADDMGGTAFPMWQVQDVFERVLKAKRVVTFADTCHSYGFSGARGGAEGVRANNLINQYLRRYASKGQRAVLTASDTGESSFEDAKWGEGHGVFTYYLLRGLKGEADRNHDGVVTAGELFAYLQQSVRQATDGKQNPRAMVGIAAGLPVSTVLRQHAGLVNRDRP